MARQLRVEEVMEEVFGVRRFQSGGGFQVLLDQKG
jgi:16S rRNA G1207 methylase RsmC